MYQKKNNNLNLKKNHCSRFENGFRAYLRQHFAQDLILVHRALLFKVTLKDEELYGIYVRAEFARRKHDHTLPSFSPIDISRQQPGSAPTVETVNTFPPTYWFVRPKAYAFLSLIPQCR